MGKDNPKLTGLVTETCTRCGKLTEVVFYSIGPAKGLICENCHEAELSGTKAPVEPKMVEDVQKAVEPSGVMTFTSTGRCDVCGQFSRRLNPIWVALGDNRCLCPKCRDKYRWLGPAATERAKNADKVGVYEATFERVPEKAADPVTRPAHYRQGGIECIDAIEAAVTGIGGFEGMCTGNTIKYLWRWKHKNGLEDLKKAKWYLERLIATVEKNGKKAD